MEAPARDPQPPLTEDVAELHLLIGEMDDELTKYRWREAVWVSIVVHVLAFLLIIFLPKYFPRGATVIPVLQETQNNTPIFLPSSPDQQRVKAPDTTTLSDKNRIAQSRTPLPSKDMLRKILDANKAGRPAKPTPPPAPTQQAAQQQNPAQANQQAANPTPPPPQPAQTAQLQTPPPAAAKNPSPFKTSGPGIQQAIQSLGAGHTQTHYTFEAGNYGSQFKPNSNIRGDVEILSDTMGVDFGPYLQRVLYVIRKNWINLIPEGAFAKKGKVGYQFAILKNGRITALQRVLPSGDVVLDRAAYGGITDSDPLDQLPREFKGDYLALRIIFLYNMDLNSSELR
jgi:hypothetical protein